MMKKFLSVFIPVILLTATAGVYVVNHYCMIAGKTTANYACCSNCNDDCCKKDIKVIRLTIETVKQSESKIFSEFDFIPFIVSAFSAPRKDYFSNDLKTGYNPVPLRFHESIRTTVLRI